MNGVSGSPAPYVLAERWDWVEAGEETAFAGFTAEILVSLRNYQRQELLDLMTRRAPDVDAFPVMAPYIRAWNAYETDEHGDPQPIPPPRDGGADSLARLEPAMSQWLYNQVLIGYRGGKGLSSSSGPSGGPRVPTNESDGKTGSGKAKG